MALKDYTFDGSKKLELEKLPTNSKKDKVDKEEIIAKTKENLAKMQELQDRLYADGREGLIIVLQAMDAAGKDSIIKHVMGGVNPQGVEVHNFKTPSAEELAHDFLWRLNKCIPGRGYIGIFNRSYYEDVLVVRVYEMNKTYHITDRVTGQPTEEFFKKRYRHIRNYEEYLYENGYRIVKIFLNLSKDKQKERFLERLDTPSKNWKFSGGDLKTREKWDEYRKAYEKAVNETATKENPWYVLPADQKWYTRYLVSEVIVKTLEEMNPQYPEMPEEEKAKIGEYREALIND